VVVYLGALRNHFAWDDTQIIVKSDLVHAWSGLWRAFTVPYWPGDWGGFLYRPLTVASFALDWHLGGPGWFHAVNLVWHGAASVLVALLAARWVGAGDAAAEIRAALAAGLVFAVHPVHVEAVANVVGRAELMAAVFSVLSVYAAVERDSLGWSAVAWIGGLLSKENAAVVPALVGLAWVLGVGRARPAGRRIVRYVVCWVMIGAAYGAIRAVVLHAYPQQFNRAPVFVGLSGWQVRLTAIAALSDFLRLLLFPLALRVDYSPNERTAVHSVSDPAFLVGALALLCWGALVVISVRRKRKEAALGLLWIAAAYAPVANLVFPAGVIMAERTLYLPSVGLCLALAAWVRRVETRVLAPVLALVVIAGGVRSALRVPVWRTDEHVMLSILEDSPDSYRGPMSAGIIYLEEHQPAKAYDALDSAIAIYPFDGRLYLLKAHAAFQTGRSDQVDSILAPVRKTCLPGCGADFYGVEAALARQIGDQVMADSLEAYKARKSLKQQ